MPVLDWPRFEKSFPIRSSNAGAVSGSAWCLHSVGPHSARPRPDGTLHRLWNYATLGSRRLSVDQLLLDPFDEWVGGISSRAVCACGCPWADAGVGVANASGHRGVMVLHVVASEPKHLHPLRRRQPGDGSSVLGRCFYLWALATLSMPRSTGTPRAAQTRTSLLRPLAFSCRACRCTSSAPC